MRSVQYARFFLRVLFIIMFLGCETTYNSEAILDCSSSPEMNFSLKQLHELSDETVLEIRDSWTVSAVVISNDQYGNMFNEIFLQTATNEVGYGIRIEMELRDSYLRFPVGTQVRIYLKGLWVRKKYGLLTLGKPLVLFGAPSIGRIPYHEIDTYMRATCESEDVQVTPLTIRALTEAPLNTLVQLQNVEFIHEEVGITLAEEFSETIRHLTDCAGREVRLITSGYADFFDHEIPDSHGRLTGILLADRQGLYIRMRSLADIQFDSERCRIPVEPVTTNSVFISEIADPDNAPEARFIEIYNDSEAEIPLEGWQLVRYTNANTEPGSSTDLSGISIGPKQVFTIVADSIGFKSIFNVNPNLEAGKNSAADSNGDDTVLLLDPFGAIIDIFGRVGEDGSGTDHEFEDGRAIRLLDINQANPEFSSTEWLIFNDTGASGTFNDPQRAPEDFTPGIRD